MGNYQKAIEYFEKSLKIELRTLGEDHASIATTYSNIGSFHQNMGNYRKALDYYEKTLKI